MFLSIIIPVYNAEGYIGETLSSLLAQNISKDDYEIICVNDGSKDSSPALLDRFAAEHPNIVVIHKENGGVTTARNAGLEAARGDYIWFVDADDLVRSDALSRLQPLAGNCDRIVFGAYRFFDTLSPEELERSFSSELPANTPWYDAVVWRCILRREFLKAHQLSFRYPELTHGEDGLFMYEVTLCSPVTKELDQVLYFYREHSGSAETTVTPENRLRKLRSYIRICDILRHSLEQTPNESGANKLMSFLWMALYETLRLPEPQSSQAKRQLKEANLFPFRRPAQCTLKRSYMTDREGLLGSIYDKLFLNLHRPWAYAVMGILMKLK